VLLPAYAEARPFEFTLRRNIFDPHTYKIKSFAFDFLRTAWLSWRYSKNLGELCNLAVQLHSYRTQG
jgi:hypothetical protein